MSEEQVLCISRRSLEKTGFLQKGLQPMKNPDALLSLEISFIPRSQAETDESWKQLIPYQLFLCNGRLLVFQRGGSVNEQRLAGRYSVGIGGHMNDHDVRGKRFDKASLFAAARRERNEELIIDGPVEAKTLGLINDDSDHVGRVHLGLVLICAVKDQAQVSLRQGGEDLVFKGWWLPDEILSSKDRFEKWSVLAVKLLLEQLHK